MARGYERVEVLVDTGHTVDTLDTVTGSGVAYKSHARVAARRALAARGRPALGFGVHRSTLAKKCACLNHSKTRS